MIVNTNKTIECIPNFSEGRDEKTLAALAQAASGVPGAALLDWSADASHNRSVYTLAGAPEAVAEAAFRLCEAAVQRIDMRAHSGGHPRIGAADVVPFVPVRGVGMDECVAISRAFGRRLWEELAVPVTLYERSASAPGRTNLADVRRGGYEGLAEKLRLPEWAPDFGDAAPHPTAGMAAVGARGFLVAYNVNLDTPDVGVADAIARAVRASSGGFRSCKAIGVFLKERGVAQVSMNLTDFVDTPIYRVQEAVRAEAARYGARILDSELIGLAPAQAFADSAAYYLQLRDYDPSRQLLETRLLGLADGNGE